MDSVNKLNYSIVVDTSHGRKFYYLKIYLKKTGRCIREETFTGFTETLAYVDTFINEFNKIYKAVYSGHN